MVPTSDVAPGELADDNEWARFDDELASLALAADPDAPLDADAVPLVLDNTHATGSLPGWYMPPIVGAASRWWKPVVLALVVALLFIEAAGLCSTYGSLVVP